MSKVNFEYADINKDRNAYKLNPDVLKGFKDSVRMGQNIQALNYLELVIDRLIEAANQCNCGASESTTTTAKTPVKAKTVAEAE